VGDCDALGFLAGGAFAYKMAPSPSPSSVRCFFTLEKYRYFQHLLT
jgi:hypothetical protein